MQIEILALRHQLNVMQQRARKRPRLGAADRWLWVWLARVWAQLALSIGYRQTGDGDRLAAKRFSALLDLEEQSR